MTGSSLAPVIIPIVVTASLAAWLIIVYYADSHPLWRHRQGRPHADIQPPALPSRHQPSRESKTHRRAA
jgi:hypothetical protein